MRRVRLAAASVAILLALTACVAIPTSGGVIEGPEISDADTPSSVLLPQRPERDAEPQAILQGFLRAGTGPQADYAVAREFLAEPFNERWQPDAGAIVAQAGSETYSQAGADVIEYSVIPLATVDAEGRYVESETTTPITMRFRFVQVDGQWRIIDAPHGTVLTASAFSLIYSAHELQFFDPEHRYFVPDERWYPVTSTGVLARRIVRALLAGPTEWLAPGVVSDFPLGTTIGEGGVRLESSRLVVDLSAEAGVASVAQLQFMRAQLEGSLTRVGAVSAVAMTIGGAELEVPPLAERPQREPSVDSRTLVLEEGEFGYAQGSTIDVIEGVGAVIAGLEPEAITWSSALRTAAVLGEPGVSRVTAEGSTLVDSRPALAEPSFDGHGYIWSAPTAEPASLTVWGADGVARPVVTALPERGRLRVIEVARDDTRVTLLTEVDGRTTLYVASVIRDQGVPVALGALHRVPTGAAQVLDVAWVDSGSIATLDLADGQYRITRHAIGGMSESLGRLSYASRIAGGVGVEGLRALGESGTIYRPQGNGWQSTGLTVDVLATRR